MNVDSMKVELTLSKEFMQKIIGISCFNSNNRLLMLKFWYFSLHVFNWLPFFFLVRLYAKNNAFIAVFFIKDGINGGHGCSEKV